MKWFRALIVAAVCLAPFSARAWWQSIQQVGVGGATYQGPGDINTTGVVAWWGLRAFSAAKRGSAVANVCNSTGGVDVGCADMVSDATTGALIPQTISGIPCPGTNCTLKILYDQSGANSCTVNSVAAQPCNVSQAVIANRPILSSTDILTTSAHSLKCSGLGVTCVVTAGSSQPYTISAVAERTSGTASSVYFGDSGNFGMGMGAANTLSDYCSATGTVGSIADNAFHAIQTLCNGASGNIYVDGSANTKSLGTAAIGTSTNGFFLGTDAFANTFTGNIKEAGLWTGDKSAAFSVMDSKQHAFWGF